MADNVTELTAMLGLNGPKAHYDARAEFMGIGVGGEQSKIESRDIQVFLRSGPVPRSMLLIYKYTLT